MRGSLTGSISPFAANWYNGILNQRSSGSIQFLKRTTVSGIQAGDILASSYTTSGDTGHVMTVKEIALTGHRSHHMDPGRRHRLRHDRDL